MAAYDTLLKLKASQNPGSGVPYPSPDPSPEREGSIRNLVSECYAAMNDDFNSPVVIANLFEGVRIINSVNDKKETLAAEDLEILKILFGTFVFDILGLKEESGKQDRFAGGWTDAYDPVIKGKGKTE